MLHTGTHKPDRDWYADGSIEILLSNPFKREDFRKAIAERNFDYAFVMYGRLRMIVSVLKERVKRLFTVGGLAVYKGFAIPEVLSPEGMLVPQREYSEISTSNGTLEGKPNHPNVKINRIIDTERVLFDIFPFATHFRYPWVYAENSMAIHEYCIVKRVLDGRKHIILPDGGLTLYSRGYARNLVHAMMLALDKEEISRGETYNVADEQTLTLKQIVEVICKALNVPLIEIINVPSDFLRSDNAEGLVCPWGPLLRKRSASHEIMDVGKMIFTLGYRDLVPVAEATAITAQWLANNLPDHESAIKVLQDPFDYDAEDEYISAFKAGDRERMRMVSWKRKPGFTAFTYTDERNPFDGLDQNQRHSGSYDPKLKKRVKPVW